MTYPAISSRVLLVEDHRGAGDAAGRVLPLRRYRLARLRFEDHASAPEGRFEYLKRTHD